VVKQSKAGIEKAIRFVLEPLLDLLGFPDAGLIPSLGLDLDLGMLPVFSLGANLNALNPAEAMAEMFENLEDAALDQVTRFTEAFPFPDPSWMNCLDVMCLSYKLPDLNLPNLEPCQDFLDEFAQVRKELKISLNKIGKNIADAKCKARKVLPIDFASQIAKLTDLKTPEDSCEIEFKVCTDFVFSRDEETENRIGEVVSPLISKLQCRLEHGIDSRDCNHEVHHHLRAGDEANATGRIFRLPLGLIPLHPLLPIPERLEMKMHFDLESFDKKEKKMSGGYINASPYLSLPIRLRRDEQGGFSLKFDLQSEININISYAKKDTADLVEASIEQHYSTAKELDGTTCCFLQFSETSMFGIATRYLELHARCLAIYASWRENRIYGNGMVLEHPPKM